jgi:DNA-binding NarL/FixJ family response regulator
VTKRIVVGDDHPMVRAALRIALASVVSDLVVDECSTLDEMITAIARAPHEVDLVLLDLSMPGPHGFSGLFLLAAQFPSVPVAIVSARSDPATINRAIDYGASGYLPKSLGLDELKAAISAILAGEVWVPKDVALQTSDEEQDNVAVGRLASLSAQQMRIIVMILEGKLNKQIAAELGIAEQTVKIHVSTILKKLDVHSRTQAALLAQKYLAAPQ